MNRTQKRCAIVVHGGAGGSKNDEPGCAAAALAGLSRLSEGKEAIDAAVAAVVALEDDGRFNAGSGSILCLDGKTVEMDASVMDTRGRLGAVACLQHVRNPVLVARAVADTPHWLLTGEGAERFACLQGFERYDAVNEESVASHRSMMQRLARQDSPAERSGSDNDAFRKYWNYPMPWDQAMKEYGCGTVGAVVLDTDGHFAVASSTGGAAPSLLGRIGDTPIVGCGYFAGMKGAVAATGIGEFIVKQLLARTVYQWIDEGLPLQQAIDRGIALFPDDIGVGLIAVTHDAAAVSGNRTMPTHIIVRE